MYPRGEPGMCWYDKAAPFVPCDSGPLTSPDWAIHHDQPALCGTIPANKVGLSEFSYDGRYVVCFDAYEARLMDLFHMKETNLRIDLTWITARLGIPNESCLRIADVLLIDLNWMVILVKERIQNRLKVHVAIAEIDEQFHARIITLLSSTFYVKLDIAVRGFVNDSMTEVGYWDRAACNTRFIYRAVKQTTGNCQWKWVKPVKLPENFKLTGLIDGCAYGFLCKPNGHSDLDELVKISIDSNEQTILNLENSPAISIIRHQTLKWVGQTLIVVETGKNLIFSRFYMMSLNSLKWREIRPRVSWEHIQLSSNENVLIMVTDLSMNNTKVYRFYRFPINQPHSLRDLAWISIRHRAKTIKKFDEYVLSRLPKTSSVRCPFV